MSHQMINMAKYRGTVTSGVYNYVRHLRSRSSSSHDLLSPRSVDLGFLILRHLRSRNGPSRKSSDTFSVPPLFTSFGQTRESAPTRECVPPPPPRLFKPPSPREGLGVGSFPREGLGVGFRLLGFTARSPPPPYPPRTSRTPGPSVRW